MLVQELQLVPIILMFVSVMQSSAEFESPIIAFACTGLEVTQAKIRQREQIRQLEMPL